MTADFALSRDGRALWDALKEGLNNEKRLLGREDLHEYLSRSSWLQSHLKKEELADSSSAFTEVAVPQLERTSTKLGMFLCTFEGSVQDLVMSDAYLSLGEALLIDLYKVLVQFLTFYKKSGCSSCVRVNLIDAGESVVSAVEAIGLLLDRNSDYQRQLSSDKQSVFAPLTGRLLHSVTNLYRLPQTVEDVVRERIISSLRLLRDTENELEAGLAAKDNEIVDGAAYQTCSDSTDKEDQDSFDLGCDFTSVDPELTKCLCNAVRVFISLLKEAVLLLARHSNQPASDMVKKTTLLDILGEKVYALTASVDACCVELYTKNLQEAFNCVDTLEKAVCNELRDVFEQLPCVWKTIQLETFRYKMAEAFAALASFHVALNSKRSTAFAQEGLQKDDA